MDIVSMIFFIIFGIVSLSMSYMREKLHLKTSTALKVLGITAGIFLLFGFLATRVEKGSIGHLLLILAIPGGLFLCLIFFQYVLGGYDKDDDDTNAAQQ